MTLLRTILLSCFLCASAWGQGWLLVQPPVHGPAITFMDGTGQQAPGVLTSFSMVRITDDQGTITGATVVCVSPDMGRVWIAPLHHVGNDLLVSTDNYSDGATVVYTNSLTGAGLELSTPDGSPVVCQVKETLQDLTWLAETNPSPWCIPFSAPSQYINPAPNVAWKFFANSLATEQPVDTNTDETASVPPMP
jgi:hypothetical protein